MPSDFYLIWAGYKFPYDFIAFGETLEEWIYFAGWLLNENSCVAHFDPWCSSLELSFDARKSDSRTAVLTATGGKIFYDETIPSSIEIQPKTVLLELGKVFSIVQKGLASKKLRFRLLDNILLEI